jgi:hypothetical protein
MRRAIVMVLLAGCVGPRRTPWPPPPLEATGRAVRCTADTALHCEKHVVRLDEEGCRAQVTTYDLCSGGRRDDVFRVPDCGAILDRFLEKQKTEGTVPCALADGTSWTEETFGASGLITRGVAPDETAPVGLACLELFRLSRYRLFLETNEGMARECNRPPAPALHCPTAE